MDVWYWQQRRFGAIPALALLSAGVCLALPGCRGEEPTAGTSPRDSAAAAFAGGGTEESRPATGVESATPDPTDPRPLLRAAAGFGDRLDVDWVWGEKGDLLTDDPRLEEAARRCDNAIARFFRTEAFEMVGDWHFRQEPYTMEWMPGASKRYTRAWRECLVRIPATDGSTIEMRGRASRATGQVTLIVRVCGEAVDGLAALGPSTLIRWPEGYELLGEVEEAPSGSGRTWRQAGWQSPPHELLDWRLRHAWPNLVRSWSDGQWLALVVTWTDLEPALAIGYQFADFLEDPDHPSFAREPGPLGPAPLDPMPRLELSPVSSSAELAAVAPEAGAVEKAPKSLGLRLLTSEEWARAEAGPASPEVAEQLGIAADTLSLRTETEIRPFGPVVAGALLCHDPTDTTEGDRKLDGYVQWALGADHLAITLVTSAAAWGSWRVKPGEALELLLGADGRRFAQVPIAREDVGDRAAVYAPVPDTEVGPPGQRYRVGDTRWGRSRAYFAPGLLHVVFER